jgi:hypothetical protein
MAKGTRAAVTMRVRIGDAEIEVTGPADFVESRIASFMKEATPRPPDGSPAEKAATTSSAAYGKKGVAPAQFIKSHNVKSDVNAVLAAGYYLEKIAGQENFTSLEIRDLISKAKRPLPKNISDSINGNIKKGLIMSAGDREGKMAFVLTTDGEEMVDSMSQTGG